MDVFCLQPWKGLAVIIPSYGDMVGRSLVYYYLCQLRLVGEATWRIEGCFLQLCLNNRLLRPVWLKSCPELELYGLACMAAVDISHISSQLHERIMCMF